MNTFCKAIFLFFYFLFFEVSTSNATILDFEDLPDYTEVKDYYSLYGVHFNEAISLTAGLSLNEFDFPPSSGVVAIGDDLGPIEISFDNPVENLFGNFTYGTQISITAYDADGSLIGNYLNSAEDNYGFSEMIVFNFTGVSKLIIAGDQFGASFIMDDFNFDPISAPVPEPSTILLLTSGLLFIAKKRKKF